MDKDKRLKVYLEVTWWVITALIIFGVMYPIHNAFKNYPFWTMNIVFIFVFITFTRYIFFIKHSLFAYNFPVKLVLVFLSFFMIFFLINSLFEFQFFLDQEGQSALLKDNLLRNPLSIEAGARLTDYVKNEMFLFSVGSIIASIVLSIRMIISIWRTRNRGTV